jgi:hypothetical protein
VQEDGKDWVVRRDVLRAEQHRLEVRAFLAQNRVHECRHAEDIRSAAVLVEEQHAHTHQNELQLILHEYFDVKK